MTMSAEQRSKFTHLIVTSPYEWKMFNWDQESQTYTFLFSELYNILALYNIFTYRWFSSLFEVSPSFEHLLPLLVKKKKRTTTFLKMKCLIMWFFFQTSSFRCIKISTHYLELSYSLKHMTYLYIPLSYLWIFASHFSIDMTKS